MMRKAKKNEKCITLDDKEYVLSEEMIVISDDNLLHGIGGVMGGLKSGCSLNTTNVFLEVALFDPVSITKTGRKLNLQSDARYRFERGIDTESIYWGVEPASQMILDLCGGEASNTVLTSILEDSKLTFDFNPDKIKLLGGVDIPNDRKTAVSLTYRTVFTKGCFDEGVAF